jgi:hypothetical protein
MEILVALNAGVTLWLVFLVVRLEGRIGLLEEKEPKKEDLKVL